MQRPLGHYSAPASFVPPRRKWRPRRHRSWSRVRILTWSCAGAVSRRARQARGETPTAGVADLSYVDSGEHRRLHERTFDCGLATPAGQESEGDCTLGDALPGPSVDDPSVCVISTEELQSLVFTLGTGLSSLEAEALRLYLEGSSYEEMAELLDRDTKTIDNALQRVKRKILTHQKSRQVLL